MGSSAAQVIHLLYHTVAAQRKVSEVGTELPFTQSVFADVTEGGKLILHLPVIISANW